MFRILRTWRPYEAQNFFVNHHSTNRNKENYYHVFPMEGWWNFNPTESWKKNIYEENMDKNIQSRFLSALGVGTWKGLIAVIAIATVAGCASSAFLTIASVPTRFYWPVRVILNGPKGCRRGSWILAHGYLYKLLLEYHRKCRRR